MKFFTQLSSMLVAVTSALAVSVSYDNTYDNSGGSLATVACSDGPNGLLSRYPTFGSLPGFPNIGGAQAVTGHGSPNCGSCWQLTYQGKSINVLAIDVATNGFNIAEAAMNNLTNKQAVFLGRIDATATQVASSVCGL